MPTRSELTPAAIQLGDDHGNDDLRMFRVPLGEQDRWLHRLVPVTVAGLRRQHVGAMPLCTADQLQRDIELQP